MKGRKTLIEVTVGWIHDMNKRIGYGKAHVNLEEFAQHFCTIVLPEHHPAVSYNVKGKLIVKVCVCLGALVLWNEEIKGGNRYPTPFLSCEVEKSGV